nr:erythroblast NAD(P)(+)--arginine ADP-ribosyltransferase-like [Zonotrichia albicollis]
MAVLVQTLALLAMAMATVANEVKSLDMAWDSFDDQYRGCGPAMMAALPALNCSEFHQNRVFSQIWAKAAATWQSWGPPESPLSPNQAIAIMAYTTEDLYGLFNEFVRMAGRSRQQFRDKFPYKTLHFLLTDAMATLRNTLQGQCYEVFLEVCGTRFDAQRGDTVRFGEFSIMGLSKPPPGCPTETMFQVHTCHGVDISFYSATSATDGVLIPPFETFEVINVTREGDKAELQLRSTGTFSKYNCEWLQGDATGDSWG